MVHEDEGDAAGVVEAMLGKFGAALDDTDDGGDQGDDGGQEDEGQEEIQAGADGDADDTVEDGGGDQEAEDDTGEAGDEDEEGEEPKPTERLSRVVQKLTRTERELASARKRIRELEESRQAPRTVSLDDRVEFARASVAEALGVDPTDARVDEELNEMFADLAIELAGDAAEADDRLRERRDRRREESRKRARERELTERLDRMEREKLELEAENRRAQGTAMIAGHLGNIRERVPFLHAQDEGDPAAMVHEVVQAWIEQGNVPRTEKEAVGMVELAASRLDEVYRQKAGRFAGLLGQKDEGPPVGKQEPRPNRKRGYTATDKTASGKNRGNVPKRDEDDDEPQDVVTKVLRKFR